MRLEDMFFKPARLLSGYKRAELYFYLFNQIFFLKTTEVRELTNRMGLTFLGNDSDILQHCFFPIKIFEYQCSAVH